MVLEYLSFDFAGIRYWAWFGVMYLLFLTYQDFKNNRLVDDRKNYFMMGISMSLISHIPQPFWYILGLIGVVVGLSVFLNKFKVVGGADVNTLAWIFFGFGIINVFKLMFFAVIFLVFMVVWVLFKNWVFRYRQPCPFYGVILVAFLFSTWFTGVLW